MIKYKSQTHNTPLFKYVVKEEICLTNIFIRGATMEKFKGS